MKNPNNFFVKNKKSLIIGGVVVGLGGVAYYIFGYKGKDGKTLFRKWTKRDEEPAPSPKPPTTPQGIKDVITGVKPIKYGGAISVVNI